MHSDKIGRREVERILGLSRAAVRKLVDDGTLSATRDLRGVLWYSRNEVSEIKQSREDSAASAVARSNHAFDFSQAQREQSDEAERERQDSASKEGQARTFDRMLRHQAKVESALESIADETRKLRKDNERVKEQLSRLMWIALGQGALTVLPKDALSKIWSTATAPEQAQARRVVPQFLSNEELAKMRAMIETPKEPS